MRQGHWAVVDLIGKGGHIRTVPIPNWVKAALDQWTGAANVTEDRIFRRVARKGKVRGKGLSQNVVWYVVRTCCQKAGLEHIAPHDLRRTCAKLCHDNGGELEQIQFLLGHVSVQTTEHYLGCKQNLGHPVNDLFDLKTTAPKDGGQVGSAVVMDAAKPVEKPSPLEIECGHGGAEDEQPICEPRPVSVPERTDLVALGRELHEVIQRTKEMANGIQQSSDLWDLEKYLTQNRKEIDRKYTYQHSELTRVFGRLLHERRVSEEELRGLREDKLASIRSVAEFLAKYAA